MRVKNTDETETGSKSRTIALHYTPVRNESSLHQRFVLYLAYGHLSEQDEKGAPEVGGGEDLHDAAHPIQRAHYGEHFLRHARLFRGDGTPVPQHGNNVCETERNVYPVFHTNNGNVGGSISVRKQRQCYWNTMGARVEL